MDRKLKLLSPEVSELLKLQLVHELQNQLLYNNFANYFSLEGILDLEAYFLLHAAEEKLHHDWIYSYLNEADCRVEYPAISVDKATKVDSIITPFIASVAREIETTQMIYAIYKKAGEVGDIMTQSWLLKDLIREQIEEENTARMARVIMEMDADIFIKAEKVLELLKK